MEDRESGQGMRLRCFSADTLHLCLHSSVNIRTFLYILVGRSSLVVSCTKDGRSV